MFGFTRERKYEGVVFTDISKTFDIVNHELLIGKFGLHGFSHKSLNLMLSCLKNQKQPSRGVLQKRRSENMHQIYRKTPMPKCGFNKIVL